MRAGDERPLTEEPFPDNADNGFTEPELFVDSEPRAEPESLREPPETDPVPPAAPALNTDATDAAVLFGTEDAEQFRLRWRELQADFVDDPKHAVEGADHLVDEVMRTLSEIVADHKRDLEDQLRDGGETEELRVALRRYRSFFEQLLNA
jgi:hypothetical protein